MPHRAAQYCLVEIIPKNANAAFAPHHLTYVQEAALRRALGADAADYFYSAVITAGDAVNGLLKEYYSWSCVKLYFSVFYCLRALLAVRGYAIFYEGRKPKILLARQGQMIRTPPASNRNRTTHGVVLESFKRFIPNHYYLSQPIAQVNSLDWLKEQREKLNYRQCRFTEPTPPGIFSVVARASVRTVLNAYLQDWEYDFEFDSDHAMLAFPVRLLCDTQRSLFSHGYYSYTPEEVRYLRNRFRDSNGPISALQTVLPN